MIARTMLACLALASLGAPALARVTAVGAGWVREELDALEAEGLLETADLPLLITRLAARRPVRVKYFTGHWLGVNTLVDLARARDFA